MEYINYNDLSNLNMINQDEKSKWMQERMDKSYSFIYHKGELEGYVGKINIGVTCIETNEFFCFI